MERAWITLAVNGVLFMQRAMARADVEHPLHIVADGQEAIEYLSGEGKYSGRTNYPLPRLITLDLKMPRKTGVDVFRWLRENRVLECLPKVVLSSSAYRRDVERGYLLLSDACRMRLSPKKCAPNRVAGLPTTTRERITASPEGMEIKRAQIP